MPKQVYKLDQFHGGLNTNADPRDIADNELSHATDIMVDELGRIRNLGGDTAHASETGVGSVGHANEINSGYGLYAWNSDRTAANVLSDSYTGAHDAADSSTVMTDSSPSNRFPVDALIGATINNVTDGSSGVITDNAATTVTVASLSGGSDNSWDTAVDDAYSISNIPTTGASYLAFSDADNTGTVMIYDMESDSWGSPITGMSNVDGGSRKDVFYSADGELRICDSEFENSNVSQWYGYIDRVYFQSVSDTQIVDQWYQTAQAISSPDDTSEFDNIQYTSVTYSSSGGNHSHSADSATADELTENTLADAGVVNMVGGIEVTVTLTTTDYGSEIPDVDDFLTTFTITTGSANLDTNTFQGVLGTSHKADDKSEYGEASAAGTKAFTYTFSFGDTYLGGSSIGTDFDGSGGGVTTYGIRTTLAGITLGSKIASCVLTTVNVIEAVVSGANTQAKLTTGNTFMQILHETTTTSGKAIGWDKVWEYGMSFIYDEKQESLIRTLFDGSNSDATTLDNSGNPTFCPKLKLYVDAGDSTFNRRITGAVWYIREASGSESSNQWTAQVEFDFVKGVSRVLSSGKEADCLFNPHDGNQYEFIVDNDHLLSPNLEDTYTSRTGVSKKEDAIKARYKTSAMVGRRMYVGNVLTTKESGVTEVKADAMLKSPVNCFDTFPSLSIVEAAVNDGESIVALEEYADRILQFKENTLYIINVSQDIEFLEDVLKYKGVAQPSAVCKTDYGIAWVNKLGCYLYDGKQVTDLIEKQGRQIIKESDWQTFAQRSPMIGYVPKKRQLIIVDDNTTAGDGSIFLYDMVTQSWVKGSAATITSQSLTNFVNDANGDLVWSHTNDTGTMKVWSDTSAGHGGCYIELKDLDFGFPGVRKKLYAININYKGDADSLTAYFIPTPPGATTQMNESNTPLADSSAVVDTFASLKPSASSIASGRHDNKYSFRFWMNGTAGADFQLNDVSFIYRLKNIK